jgi:prophage DNA circulation protein
LYKDETKEAVPICRRILIFMLEITATRGRTGADFRTAVGQFLTNAPRLIQYDLAGPPLADIFDKSRLANITMAQLDQVRAKALEEHPVTLGATLIQNALIHFTLATESRILADIIYTNHEDAEAMKLRMNAAFLPMEELAADDMDQVIFNALISLHAAISYFLVETARPLPRMINFQFFSPSLPTLLAAYRLYADAARADELREENKVVHPLFMRPYGRALSN